MTTDRTGGLAAFRQQDTSRRREAVLRALDQAAAAGETATISGIARRAGVHRTFIHRHPDLHAAVNAQAAQPPPTTTAAPAVSRESLAADLVNLQARNSRMAQTITALERRLAEALGEAVWRESGLGAPVNVATLEARITGLEQENVTLRARLVDSTDELDAARAANRQLMAQLNTF